MAPTTAKSSPIGPHFFIHSDNTAIKIVAIRGGTLYVLSTEVIAIYVYITVSHGVIGYFNYSNQDVFPRFSN